MVLELVGLPGTGKSTFARTIAKEGKYVLITVRGSKETIFLNLLAAMRNPLRYFRLLYFTLKYLGPRRLWYEKFVNLFLIANAKYEKARRVRFAIIDQGYFQNYISLIEVDEHRDRLLSYLKIFSVSDLVVFFDLPEMERLARIAKRGYGVRQRMPAEYRAKFEKTMQSGAAFLRTIWSRTLPHGPGTRLPSMVSITDDDSARKVMEVLRSSAQEPEKILRPNIPAPVVFVVNARMPTERAHGLQIVRTAEALIGEGVQTLICVPKRKNRITESVEEYYGCPIPIPVRRLWCIDLFGTIPAVHAHRIVSLTFMISVLFMRLKRDARYITRNPELAWVLSKRRAKVFYEAHTSPARFKRVFRMFLSGVNGVIANSHGTANALGRVIPNTVSVIPNGVDIERFTLVGGPEVFRKELGLPPAGHVVMYVGGFYEWKGVGTLLQAWNEPALRGHSLVLVGGTKEELLRLVDHDRSFSWEGIELFPHQPAELIPRFLHAADVLVLPNAPISEESVSHTSPIKLFEYMASERPIVASDLPSIREIVDENSAVLFKAGDPRSLGGAIVRTLNQGSGLKEMVANAKNIAQKYSWSMRAKRIVDVLSV